MPENFNSQAYLFTVMESIHLSNHFIEDYYIIIALPCRIVPY